MELYADYVTCFHKESEGAGWQHVIMIKLGSDYDVYGGGWGNVHDL